MSLSGENISAAMRADMAYRSAYNDGLKEGRKLNNELLGCLKKIASAPSLMESLIFLEELDALISKAEKELS